MSGRADDAAPDRSLDGAEWVLGTLTSTERAEFERVLAVSPAVQADVLRWENWLSGLNDLLPEVTPPAGLWTAIAGRLRPVAPAAPPRPALDLVTPIRRSRARWRAATLTFAALAAALALFVASERLRPAGPSYLAVVDRGGGLPALIVHVDTSSDIVTVRAVAAETPSGRVLELWYIADGQAPRAVGLLDGAETRTALPPATRSDLAGATLAVSVEPEGGSTTGAPTGPVVYSGKLFRER